MYSHIYLIQIFHVYSQSACFYLAGLIDDNNGINYVDNNKIME